MDTEEKRCQCPVCQYMGEYEKNIDMITDSGAKEFFGDLYDRYLLADEERDLLVNMKVPKLMEEIFRLREEIENLKAQRQEGRDLVRSYDDEVQRRGDEITRLREENERLRNALKPFAYLTKRATDRPETESEREAYEALNAEQGD